MSWRNAEILHANNFWLKLNRDRLWLKLAILVLPVFLFLFFFSQSAGLRQFEGYFGAGLPKNSSNHLVDSYNSRECSMFVFEADRSYLLAVQNQVFPKWRQLEACSPTNNFDVPKIIQTHKLYQDIRNNNRTVFVGRKTGSSDAEVIVFCSDLDTRAWVVIFRMESTLSGMSRLLAYLILFFLGIYLISHYKQKAVKAG